MATASVLFVAAEAREFAGVLHHCGPALPIESHAAFAREIQANRRRWILLANGPGPRAVRAALTPDLPARWNIAAVVSTGFCGALDPHLKIGDIVVSGASFHTSTVAYQHGEIWSADRVAIHAEEKRRLREETGASVVEMEFAAVQDRARDWGLPCHAVRVVSDTAGEDLPLDFNRYRDSDGRFQLPRIALAAIRSPFRVLPGLVRLERQTKAAAEKLGVFLANSEL